jgi:hypothetical protein
MCSTACCDAGRRSCIRRSRTNLRLSGHPWPVQPGGWWHPATSSRLPGHPWPMQPGGWWHPATSSRLPGHPWPVQPFWLAASCRGFTTAQLRRELSEGLPVPREPGSAASEARMAKRSRCAVSGGQDARSERPATGHGQPRAPRTSGGACGPSLSSLPPRPRIAAGYPPWTLTVYEIPMSAVAPASPADRTLVVRQGSAPQEDVP